MSKFLYLFYFFLISFRIVLSYLPDIVINSTYTPTWSSLVFVIPDREPLELYWIACRKFSRIYCLQNFYATTSNNNPALRSFSSNPLQALHPDLRYNFIWFEKMAYHETERVFESSYKRINNFVGQNGCCTHQYFEYFTAGFLEMLLTPQEYYTKLTDFSDENKKLNEIWAYFSTSCDSNVITKLGFGIGQLQRKNHLYGLPRPKFGMPYVLNIGNDWTPSIPFLNPGDFLTFGWFKQNVMCLDQSWICDVHSQPSPSSQMEN